MSSLSRFRIRSFTLLLFSALLLSSCTLPWQKKEVSGLQVTTDGISASVFLNGNQVGSTPYSDQSLKPGSYSVRLEPVDEQLAPFETSVTLYSTTLGVMNWTFGKTAETSGGVVYELEPLKKKKDAHFSLASIPDGAIVKVDDISQGFTPVLMKSMTPGTHRFQVTLPGYKEQAESVNIAQGFQMNVTVKLAKQKITAPLEEAVLIATDSAQASSSAKIASPSAKLTIKPSGDATKPATASATTSSKSLEIKETGTGWLRVRATPESSGTELAKVDVGKTFPFFSTQAGWYEIEYAKGKKGWVSSKYVKEVK